MIKAVTFLWVLTSVWVMDVQSRILFEEDFESYKKGSAIDGQGGWIADESYVIIKGEKGQAVFSGRDIDEAAISHEFKGQDGTFYIGVDVQFSLSAINFFWIAAGNERSEDNTVGAVFGVKDGEPTVLPRVWDNSEKFKAGLPVVFSNPSRLVIEVAVSGQKYTSSIWMNPKSRLDLPMQSATETLRGDALDIFYARRGSAGHSAMTMDNLVIATTFEEAAGL